MQREYFVHNAGIYFNLNEEGAKKSFIDIIEGLIEGTDISYFTLMIDPEPKARGER